MIAQRFHFHKRDQAAGESIADYDASLRKLASQCKFGDRLEEALRNRFVCGLRHEAIQRCLLSEADLSYTKAMEIANAMEATDRDRKSLNGSEAILGGNCKAYRVKARIPKRVTGAIELATVPAHANSKKTRPMHVERRATLRVRVQYSDQFAKLILVVVEGSGPSLLGHNWLKYLRLDWSRIAQVHATRLKTLNLVLDQHKAIF